MIDPDRVTQIAYLPGERVRTELGFNWDGEPTAVTAHFRRFVGFGRSRIVLHATGTSIFRCLGYLGIF